MTPPISAWLRRFERAVSQAITPQFSPTVSTAESDLARLWSETQSLAEASGRGTPEDGEIRRNLDQLLSRYQGLDNGTQIRLRPMAVLAWAQRRLLDGDTDGVLHYLRAQQRQTPELGEVEPIHTLENRLNQRQQLIAGQFISQIAHLAVQIDIENRLPHTRWWNRSQTESRLQHWAQSYQASVQSGENALAAFERLKPEFLRISDSLGQVLNEEGLWSRIGAIATQNSIAGMEMQLMDLASRWSHSHPALAGNLYQSLRNSTFSREAQEAQARLGGEASRFLRNLTPWTAESNQAFAMNLLTVGAFIGAGWIGAGVRGIAGRSLASLLGAERAATVGGRFLIGSGQWLAGTVTSAALLPVLTHGGEPFATGTYFREFGHNLLFSGFLGLSEAWTHAVRNVMVRGIASYASAVGGMAAFDLWTQPALRNESPLELAAYFVAQDALGRAGHRIGEQGRELAHRTILDETWQNRTQERLAHWWNSSSGNDPELSTRLAPVAMGLAVYALDRFAELHLLDGIEAFLPMIGMAGRRRSSLNLFRDYIRSLQSGEDNQALVLDQLRNVLEDTTPTLTRRDLQSLTDALRPLTEHEDLKVCRKSLDIVVLLLTSPERIQPAFTAEWREMLQNALRSDDPDLREVAIKASLIISNEGNAELIESGAISILELKTAASLHLEFLRENPEEYEIELFDVFTNMTRIGLLGVREFEAIDSVLEARKELLSNLYHFDEYMMREFQFPPFHEGRQPVASFIVDNFLRIMRGRPLNDGEGGEISTVEEMVSSLLENRSLDPSLRIRIIHQALETAFSSRNLLEICEFVTHLPEYFRWANAQQLVHIFRDLDTRLQASRERFDLAENFQDFFHSTSTAIADSVIENASATQLYALNQALVELPGHWHRNFALALHERLTDNNPATRSLNGDFRLAAWWTLVHLSNPADQSRHLETLVNLIVAWGVVSPERLPPLALSLFGKVASFRVIRRISSLIFGQLEDPQSLLDTMVLGLGEARQSRNRLELEERRVALQAFLDPWNNLENLDHALIQWGTVLEGTPSETFRIGLREALDVWLRGEEQEDGSSRTLIFHSLRNDAEQLRLRASRLLDLINASATDPVEQRDLLEQFLAAYLPQDLQAWNDWTRRDPRQPLSEDEALFEEIHSVLTSLRQRLPIDDRFHTIVEFLQSAPQR